MKTKVIGYRCTEKEYETLRQRALKIGEVDKKDIGTSELVRRIVSFFCEIENMSFLWNELPIEAKRRGVDSSVLLIDIFERMKNEPIPKKSI